MNCIACNNSIKDDAKWVSINVFNKESIEIQFCKNCGLGKTLINNDSMTDVNQHQYNNLINRIDIYFGYLKNHLKIRYSLSISNIKKYNKGNKLLEVGSNIGFTLDIAQNLGFEAYGCEINDNCKKFSELVFDLKIFPDFFTIKDSFDIIILNDVLEHFPNPQLAIEQAHKLLNHGGVLFVQLPNIESNNAVKRKGGWKYLIAPDHTYHFNTKSLTLLLENNGFIKKFESIVSPFEDIWPFNFLSDRLIKLIYSNPYYFPRLYKKKNGELIQAIFVKQ